MGLLKADAGLAHVEFYRELCLVYSLWNQLDGQVDSNAHVMKSVWLFLRCQC